MIIIITTTTLSFFVPQPKCVIRVKTPALSSGCKFNLTRLLRWFGVHGNAQTELSASTSTRQHSTHDGPQPIRTLQRWQAQARSSFALCRYGCCGFLVFLRETVWGKQEERILLFRDADVYVEISQEFNWSWISVLLINAARSGLKMWTFVICVMETVARFTLMQAFCKISLSWCVCTGHLNAYEISGDKNIQKVFFTNAFQSGVIFSVLVGTDDDCFIIHDQLFGKKEIPFDVRSLKF